jgi:hypothetical protein
MTSTVPGNFLEVTQRIRKACERSGRTNESVTLIAVTKFQSIEAVKAVAAAGATQFAESRVQEARDKVPGLKSLGTWHFIGHLQTNKARLAVELFDVIQSVDSLRLAETLDAAAADVGKTLGVFLQVNISGEAQKHGFSPAESPQAAEAISHLSHVRLQGLMGMAADADETSVRAAFRRLRELKERLAPVHPGLKLSMGMSGDYEIAIEEGADFVRIGTALFKA